MKMMMLLAAASLTIATGASAQMNSTTAAKTTAAKTVPAKTSTTFKPATTVKPAVAKPAATTSGNKVTTTTSTGKKITYDCSKKGNLNKKACKG